jgi:hypothetical protein
VRLPAIPLFSGNPRFCLPPQLIKRREDKRREEERRREEKRREEKRREEKRREEKRSHAPKREWIRGTV